MGAWIETVYRSLDYSFARVAPHVGAWIETVVALMLMVSVSMVAPHVGAWIETDVQTLSATLFDVAPHVGAWIETVYTTYKRNTDGKSHPMWVRGLKR